ncbi:hypothetical protein ACFV1N_25595 [Streptosporangium canum]|uniref:hypothetical protein n=1 Tax=Streptosporangium canum TaxID=324952 RepID=UPI00368FB2DC
MAGKNVPLPAAQLPVIGAEAFVHLNLRTGYFSISDRRTKRVLYHAIDVTLEDVTFIVHETTRQRVISERCRRVHAWALGTLVDFDSNPDVRGMTRVTYNPYRCGHFTTTDGTPVERAALMIFRDRAGYQKDN